LWNGILLSIQKNDTCFLQRGTVVELHLNIFFTAEVATFRKGKPELIFCLLSKARHRLFPLPYWRNAA